MRSGSKTLTTGIAAMHKGYSELGCQAWLCHWFLLALQILEAPPRLENLTIRHPPSPKERLHARLCKRRQLLLEKQVQHFFPIASKPRILKRADRELAASLEAIEVLGKVLCPRPHTSTQHIAHFVQRLVAPVAPTLCKTAITSSSAPCRVPVKVNHGPSVAFLSRERLGIPRPDRAIEILEGRLNHVYVQFDAQRGQLRLAEKLGGIFEPLQDVLLVSEALASRLVGSHVCRLIHEGKARDGRQSVPFEAFHPLYEPFRNPKPSLSKLNVGPNKVGLELPESRWQGPDTVIGSIRGSTRKGVQVQEDLKAMALDPAQESRKPIPWYCRKGSGRSVEGVRHDCRAFIRIVSSIDLRVNFSQRIGERCPCQGHTYGTDPKLGDGPQVVVGDEGAAVRLEDSRSLRLTALVHEPRREHTLGRPRLLGAR
mmetsp:Transcript_20603/g.44806  ORF Transcript_20603/g.44806 Transcript_20603/m.44806 type:complete len:427 (-) Transcript_20603:379-1659(-)